MAFLFHSSSGTLDEWERLVDELLAPSQSPETERLIDKILPPPPSLEWERLVDELLEQRRVDARE
jgi:hypothetical protein